MLMSKTSGVSAALDMVVDNSSKIVYAILVWTAATTGQMLY
jgi:hypothetical protein